MIWIRPNTKKQNATNRKTKQTGKEPDGSIQNGQTEQTEQDRAISLKRAGGEQADVKAASQQEMNRA